jgi:hypothetical protein
MDEGEWVKGKESALWVGAGPAARHLVACPPLRFVSLECHSCCCKNWRNNGWYSL